MPVAQVVRRAPLPSLEVCLAAWGAQNSVDFWLQQRVLKFRRCVL